MPFEVEGERHDVETGGVCTPGRRAEDEDADGDAPRAEPSGQRECLRPNPADGVGGQQHPHAADASSRSSGKGRASCNSLKPSKVRR